MHRILKPMGSIYLHCDPTMSYYLKLAMDAVFWKANFRSVRKAVEAIALGSEPYIFSLLSDSQKNITDETLLFELTGRGYDLTSLHKNEVTAEILTTVV